MTAPASAPVPAIVVHGGAGVLDPDRIPRCRQGCEAAAQVGWAVLARGGSALEAVEAAVRVLEDDGEFNAGYGAVLNRDGVIEVDAAIMDGSLGAGAVGAVPWMRHPITLARHLLDEGRHILIVGEGAIEFAHGRGIAPEVPGSMITERARSRWERERRGTLAPSATGDTVGAVAIDRQRRLATGCSTGGISYKHPGRVGDSPILGAGLYAQGGAGAATATGHGESILRVTLCRAAVDAMARGQSAEAAAEGSIRDLASRLAGLPHLPVGTAGIITIDASGGLGHYRNADVMPWAAVQGGETSCGD